MIYEQLFGLKPPISNKAAKVKFLCDGIVMSSGCDFGNVIKRDELKIRFKLSNSDVMNSNFTKKFITIIKC